MSTRAHAGRQTPGNSVGSARAYLHERGLRATLALLSVAALALSSSCSRQARAVRLPALSPGDEIYRVTCEDEIGACREEARDVCRGSYQVLETAGAPIEPPRVSSAPGPRSTGPRYQRLKWVGQMVVACGSSAPDATEVARSERSSEPQQPALAADRLCIPGVTQECLGPAACRGAQACLADGKGYGPCDCGPLSAPLQSGGLHVSPDAGAPASNTDLRP